MISKPEGRERFFGLEQSGHLNSIGLELYFEWIQESLQLKKDSSLIEPEIRLPFSCSLPRDYISDPNLRLLYYKTLAENPENQTSLEKELEEEFGLIPEEVSNLFILLKIKSLSKDLLIRECIVQGGSLLLIFDQKG